MSRNWNLVRRKFKEEWELLYAVKESEDKPLCLICNKLFADNKVDNIRKHYQASHSDFDSRFPCNSNDRKKEISRLKSTMTQQKQVLKRYMTSSELTTLASYRVAWILAKNKKPFSDGAIVKEILINVMEVLLENYPSEIKSNLLKNLNTLQLSHQTIARRIVDISCDIEKQLKSQLADCRFFSVSLDESCDISDTAQLVFWVRYTSQNFETKEELLAMCGMRDRVRALDILNVFNSLVEKFELNLSKLVSVTTDGAATMTGVKSGFIALFRKQIQDSGSSANLIAIHCILHQQNLAVRSIKTGDFQVVETVEKIVNFLRSSSLRHRQFIELLKDCDTEHIDLPYFFSVRWLSCGNLLGKFSDLLEQIKEFLISKGTLERFAIIDDENWKCDLCFLADFTVHLNDINTQMQGKGRYVWELYTSVRMFRTKLLLLQNQMNSLETHHFPRLQSLPMSIKNYTKKEKYVKCIKEVHDEFGERFSDFDHISLLFSFNCQPFDFDISKVGDVVKLLSMNCSRLEHESLCLQAELCRPAGITMHQLLNQQTSKQEEYLALSEAIARIATMVGLTWLCAATFSAVTYLKSRYRSKMLDNNLEAELRCAVTNELHSNFNYLVYNKQCQILH